VSGLRAKLAAAMPAMLGHEGVWTGTYRHVDRDGTLLDVHRMTTRCEFPDDGPYAYIQHNRLEWDDGRVRELSFGGVLEAGRLVWDTDRFHGYGWETMDGVILLNLERKDEADTHFIEMITLGGDGRTRARTWQWFTAGQPTKRTLCDEEKIG